MKQKIAIIGSNGYLGRHLAQYLSARNFVCFGFDVHATSNSCCRSYCQCDVTDDAFWAEFKATKFDAIVFLSGLSGPERSFAEAEKFIEINVLGLLKLLGILRALGERSPRVIFPSSRLVYEGGCRVAETSPIRSRSVYAATKVACEQLLSAYRVRYSIPSVILRICVPYGNMFDDYSYGTIGFFVRQVRAGEPITVYGDGRNRKTYTYIGDICEIIMRSIIKPVKSDVYNVGGFEYSLLEVAQLIAERHSGRIVSVPWPDAALRVEMGDIALDATKLDDAIGRIDYQDLADHLKEL